MKADVKSERSHDNKPPKINWALIFSNIEALSKSPIKTKPTPLPARFSRYLDGDQDAGIAGDEAFELNREKQAMDGWGK